MLNDGIEGIGNNGNENSGSLSAGTPGKSKGIFGIAKVGSAGIGNNGNENSGSLSAGTPGKSKGIFGIAKVGSAGIGNNGNANSGSDIGGNAQLVIVASWNWRQK